MENKKVNLFLIGAPKTGTTTLYHYFKNHKDIFVPKVKEPGYFSRTILGTQYEKSTEDYEVRYSSYLNLFDSGYKYNVDCSTSYLRTKKGLEEINKKFPKAKIIVCLRNPYDLVVSWHYQKVKEGQELIYDFQNAWENCVYLKEIDEPRVYRKDALDYKKIGKLGNQLKQVYGIFPKENILILDYGKLKNDRDNFLSQIADFLDIKPFEGGEIKANAGKKITPKFIRDLKKRNVLFKKLFLLGRRYLPGSVKNLISSNSYTPAADIDFLKTTGYFDAEIDEIEKTTGLKYEK